MEKFFSIFGKIMLVVIVLGSISYGAYYFGTQTKSIKKPEAVQTENESVLTEELNSPYPTTTQQPLVTIIGGVAKSAGLSFDQYSIQVSNDWITSKESQTAMDETLTLSKNGYEIKIFQAATGGALCLYPGDADFEGPSSKFDTYKSLTTKDNRTLRRSGDLNGVAFTVCQKSVDNSFQQPTIYGHMSVKMPNTWTQEMLTEIDSILSTLKKI
ncbi:MAG: hypothetical protein QY322_03850 [bacterium]|nr:MAG: hypothetical protein QY322_03850 [bacterium]